MSGAWPFAQPPNLAVVTVAQILRNGRPILYVTHDEDDAGWQFLTGETTDVADAMVVGLGEMVAYDPSLADLSDLPPGWCATRADAKSAWIRFRRS